MTLMKINTCKGFIVSLIDGPLGSFHLLLSGHEKIAISPGLKLFAILPRIKSVKRKAF